MQHNLQRFTAAASAGLLLLSAIIPIEAAHAQTPRNPRGGTAMTAQPSSTRPSIVAPTPNPEALFVPIQPCRAIATAASNGGGPIPANTSRNFYVSGTTGFTTQGGPSGGCGVPSSASAVAISFTALNATSSGAGKIIAYPYGATLPSTVAVSFSPDINQTSSVVVGINQSQISVYAKVSSVLVAGDITGYFVPQMQAYIQMNGTIYSGTPRIISASHTATGQYQVVVDRDVLTCTTVITPGDPSAGIGTGYGDANNTIRIFLFSLTNGAFMPADMDFNVVEQC